MAIQINRVSKEEFRKLRQRRNTQRYLARHPELKAIRQKAAADWKKENPERAKAIMLKSYHKDPVRKLIKLARRRAKERGLEFNLTPEDVVIPELCPVLGIPLLVGPCESTWVDGTATLDRIDNSKGYIKGNVLVVSWRANRIKGDASVEELVKLAEFYSTLQLIAGGQDG
jgi:hypothetical protein